MGEPTLAGMKAELAQLGVSLPVGARIAAREMPEDLPDHVPVIVLERVQPGRAPGYCVHGYANCLGCDHLCYLGSESVNVAITFQAYPLCKECSVAWIPPGTPPDAHVADHRRADGPH